MNNMKKTLALLLAFAMVFGLAACTNGGSGGGTETPQENTTPLVVGYSPFSSKFSPFFSETAYDRDVYAMTQIPVLRVDRMGAVVEKGIEGTVIPYNGTDYTYYGPADVDVVQNADGSVDYNFKLREDLVFSDGEPLTIDDVIFTMYVLCDPTYDGSSTLFAQPISGMAAYRSGMETLLNIIYNAGRDGSDYTYFTAEQQADFWARYDAATQGLAQDITDYCLENYADYGAVDVATSAELWGFSAPDNTIEGFAAALEEKYGADIQNMISTETAGASVDDLFPNITDYSAAGVTTGTSAANIEGIKKTGDYSMTIHMDQFDATTIYQLTFAIAPLHYYGDKAAFDYDNNNFGFPKGDLSSVRAKTTQPLGAGPYKFIKFENGVVYFEANENYYLGAPKTKYLNFQECRSDDDKLNGVLTGTIDITDPTFSTDNINAIQTANGGELCGPKVETNTVDNLGYGYIGISADSVNVGGKDKKASDASKALRKAFGTIFSVYRDVAVDSYYGDRASVINYPISNTSWAAPQSTDDGYRLAFSLDVNGNDIYTSGMDAEAKYAAAKEAALGFFEAAGYTVADGKVVAAPAGASMEYEVWIPADGSGDHPSFMILTEARDAMAELGINLVVKDLTNSSDLWTGLQAGSVPMWCAAWGATPDPDMYQIYYSDIANGGANPGGSNYMYDIADADLDQMIIDARMSADQTYRKAMYKACLDTIIDWAVEIPVYQRQNAIIFSAERVNLDTITPDITTFYGWMEEIQNTELQ